MVAEAIAIAEIIVPAVVSHVAPLFVEYVKGKVSERKESLADLHEVLKKGLERLLALQVDNDKKLTMTIKKDASEDYKRWKKRVSEIEEKVASLNDKYEAEEKKDNERRTLPNLQRSLNDNRRILREDIKKALGDVIKLLGEYSKEILVDKPLERVIEELVVPSIEEYESLHKAFEEIKDLLKNNEVKCVALWGQKGAGKTTIMQHLNNHFCDDSVDDNKFEVVIFIKVPADEKNDIQILRKIADRMKVDGEVDDFRGGPRKIQKVLDKRFLLILDGIRHPPNGIWEKLHISENKVNSKVVITTQYPLVLKSKYVDRIVKLEKLSPADALKMFRAEIAGGEHLPGKQIIQLVCKKFCCCVPLLVNRIAKSFIYHEAPIDWNKAVNECTPWPQVANQQSALNERMPQLQDDEEGLTELASNLGICFQMLGEQSKKKCFLYASLYPANENIYTDYLVECCIVQGFFDDVAADTTYSEMRRTALDVILRHLVNAAFLEEGEQMRYVKMDDLYRQFALYISSSEDPDYSECRIYVDNEKHTEAFRSKSCQNARWVSMIGSKRVSLPTSQNSGSLQTVLLLQKNLKLVNIPDGYFRSMGNLLVLNLYGAEISKLPSLEGLTGLKAFYLNRCSKLEISSDKILQPLKHLEVFDIRGIKVNFVPCFESLRCLRISYIPSDIYDEISKLHKLEELTIEGCNQMSNNVDEEIKVYGAINYTLPGNAADLLKNMEQLHLKDSQAETIDSKGRFSKLHTLTLKNTSIIFKVAVDVFPELENLVVQNCSRIEVLINVTVSEQSILPKLKMVKLDDLPNIKSICPNENVAWGSLENLYVRKCPELKALPFNTENATSLTTIEGEKEWWNSLKWTRQVREQFEYAFSAST